MKKPRHKINWEDVEENLGYAQDARSAYDTLKPEKKARSKSMIKEAYNLGVNAAFAKFAKLRGDVQLQAHQKEAFEKLSEPRWVKEFRQKIQQNNPEAIQDMGHRLMRGHPLIMPEGLETYRSLLNAGGNDPVFKNSLGGDRLVNFAKRLKKSQKSEDKYTRLGRPGLVKERYAIRKEKERGGKAPDVSNWVDHSNVDPESLVDISHGGTTDYLNDYLAGRHKGYATDHGVDGLYVSPLDRTRDSFYANRASLINGAPAAILNGKIPAKYLKADGGKTGEAILSPDAVPHLQNATVSRSYRPIKENYLKTDIDEMTAPFPRGIKGS